MGEKIIYIPDTIKESSSKILKEKPDQDPCVVRVKHGNEVELWEVIKVLRHYGPIKGAYLETEGATSIVRVTFKKPEDAHKISFNQDEYNTKKTQAEKRITSIPSKQKGKIRSVAFKMPAPKRDK